VSSGAADLIVVGLGAAGSAALYHAARRGARVIGLDRHHPPHDQGSSHGETRITREAIGEGLEYVPLARRSQLLWREVERESGETLFSATGLLMISPPGLGAVHHGKHDFLERTIEAARAFGIDHEALGPAEVRARYPALHPRDEEVGYFEPGAGLVHPERCVAAHLALAARHGARIESGEAVVAIDTLPGGVRVSTAVACYEAEQVVVAAGAWAPGLLGGAYERRLALHRQTVHWFAPADPAAFAPGRFPVFLWMHGRGAEDWFYGFPEISPGAGVKIASEQFARSTATPDDLDRTVTRDEALTAHGRQVSGRIDGLPDAWVHSSVCVYTTAPESRFVIGRDPERERLIVVSACSGHGFKHSPAIGEAVASLALDGSTPPILAPFGPDRLVGP